MIDNKEFLKAVFGDDWQSAHITAFTDDPSNIAKDRRGMCWGGRHAGTTPLPPGNQYFTISRFKPLDGKAVRRKDCFLAMYVVVADDVREKLPLDQVQKLPAPSYKLLTSAKSEQWGWILTTPCTDRIHADNLLDGLVLQGLAPDGQDPGMRGITRYVRLPDGHNSKTSRLIDGKPFKCKLLEWHPKRLSTMDELAAPFGIDLNSERRDNNTSEKADVDHPVLQMVKIKGTNRHGEFDISCPWINEHTDQQDDGTVIFTNKDLSFGFKCHHGHCQDRTGKHIVKWIEVTNPNWSKRVDVWKTHKRFGINKDFNTIALDTPPSQPVVMTGKADGMSYDSFIAEGWTDEQLVSEGYIEPTDPNTEAVDINNLIKEMTSVPYNKESFSKIREVLYETDKIVGTPEKIVIWEYVREYTGWNQQTLKKILSEERKKWFNRDHNKPPIPKHEFAHISEINGMVQATDTNLKTLLKHYGIKASHNIITYKDIVIVPGITIGSNNYETNALTSVKILATINNLPIGQVADILDKICADNQFNPVVDYFKKLQQVSPGWIQNLADCLIVAPDDKQTKDKIFRLYMIAACAAADHAETTPNINAKPTFGYVMVLVGEQGISKTSFLEAMLPGKLKEFFKGGQNLNLEDKDSIMKNLQFWISEWGEVNSTFKKADIDALKAFLTDSVDIIRLPYGRRSNEIKRRTIFVASVNDPEFLKDHTGNRRYWPIQVEKINLPIDHEAIDHAWSEAWSAYIGGEQWWPTTNFGKQLNIYRRSFLAPSTNDGVEDILLELIQNKQGCFERELMTVSDIVKTLETCNLFGHSLKEIPSVQMISKILKKYGMMKFRKLKTHRLVFHNELEQKYRKMPQKDMKNIYEDSKTIISSAQTPS